MPIGEKLDYKCQFDENSNGLYTQVQYILKNDSINPQRTILYDFEGINSSTAFTPQYDLISRTQHENNGEIKICGYDTEIPLQKFEDYANPKEKIHQADWSVMIEPPLEPKEKIEILRLSYDKNIYKKSIKGKETDFSFRPRIPFKTLNITIVPPIGFIISNYEIIIDNQKGKKIEVPSLLIKSSLKIIGGNMIWSIPFPKITIRYKIKFQLQKIF